MSKEIVPELGKESYSCPHCNAIAHQTWFSVFAQRDQESPFVIDEAKARTHIASIDDKEEQEHMLKWLEAKLARLMVFDEKRDRQLYGLPKIDNLSISQCYSCKQLALWLYDVILWPAQSNAISANIDMPDDIRRDFYEAATIVHLSPRGAAALLRLSVQKLCCFLGQKGKNIDDDIAALVKMGLDVRIQKALDIIRVIGNEAVHPGSLDLRDDKSVATQLFGLINAIVEAMISQPLRVEELYGRLPENKRLAIERRDKGSTKD